eukprot:4551387-Prymnesium_polylepis.1
MEKEQRLRALLMMTGVKMRWCAASVPCGFTASLVETILCHDSHQRGCSTAPSSATNAFAWRHWLCVRANPYWLSEWLTSSLLLYVTNTAFLVFGQYAGITVIVRSFDVMLALLLLWSQCVVGMAMLFSCAFDRLLVSNLATYLAVVLFVLFSVILNQLVVDDIDGNYPSALFILAPFAYYRAVHLIGVSTFTLGAPGDEMSSIFAYLALDAAREPAPQGPPSTDCVHAHDVALSHSRCAVSLSRPSAAHTHRTRTPAHTNRARRLPWI